MPTTPRYFLGLLCVATCRAQITQRVDVRISAANWDTLAAATVISTQKNPYFASHLTPPIFSFAHLQGKSKDDGNDYVDGCIRVNGGPWSTSEVKRKGSSTWQPLGKRASVKFKKIDPELSFWWPNSIWIWIWIGTQPSSRSATAAPTPSSIFRQILLITIPDIISTNRLKMYAPDPRADLPSAL